VLLEILRLVEKGKYPISFDDLVKNIENHARYEVIPLNTKVISILKNIYGLELHDRVIVATAMMTNTILVSKDREIRAAGLNVIWSAI
jgi:PIN domain nuclease of toxin-antitoxin system